MTVTWLDTLETKNDRKGFGICIFSHTNQPDSKALPVLQSSLKSIHESGNILQACHCCPKKHKKTKHFMNSVINLTLCSFR